MMRAMSCGVSARTTRLLVRGSIVMAALGVAPGVVTDTVVSGTTRCSICMMSMAEAFCRRTIWMSAPDGRSIDSMIRWMRRTFSA